MYVADWMTKRLTTIKPLDNILHAREILEEKRVNQLPVVTGDKLVGIITDRDLRDAFPSVFDEASGSGSPLRVPKSDPKKVTVEMVMTQNLFSIGPRATISEAAELMRRERIGALPVIDGGKLVGLITRSDLLRALVKAENAKP